MHRDERTGTQLIEDIVNGVPEIIVGTALAGLGLSVLGKTYMLAHDFLRGDGAPPPPPVDLFFSGPPALLVASPFLGSGLYLFRHGYRRITNQPRPEEEPWFLQVR